MNENIFISWEAMEADFEVVLRNSSFPLTKAEIIYKARIVGAPPAVLDLLNCLPARFYRSKSEVIQRCLSRRGGTGMPPVTFI